MLRKQVISGSVLLVLRSIAGIGVSLVGNVLVLRIFDLKTYGLYGLVYYWMAFFSGIVDLGLNTYLARSKEQASRQFTSTAFTLAMVQAVVGFTVIGLTLAPVLGNYYHDDVFPVALRILAVSYVVRALGVVSLGLLERDLAYGRLGLIEIASQVFFYVPATVLGLCGWGVFALVVAELAKGVLTSTLAVSMKPVRWGWRWDRQQSWAMLRYGSGVTASSGLYLANSAVVPLLVGKMVGVEGVGILRVAQSIGGQLGFLKSITWRVSIPAIAQIRDQTDKIRRAVCEGAYFQLFLVGLPLLGFMSIGYWLVPVVFSAKWAPVATVLVLASLPLIVNAMFCLQSSALYVIGANWDVARWTIVYAALLWPLSFLTVMKFGYFGVPMAEILVLPTYYIQHRAFVRRFGRPEYEDVLVLLALLYGAAVAAWWIKVPWLSLSVFGVGGLGAIGLSKRSRRLLSESLSQLQEVVIPSRRVCVES